MQSTTWLLFRLLETYNVHEQFWERLAGLPRQETAKRAGCRYLAESDGFVISLLGTEYLVNPAQRTIRAAGASEEGSGPHRPFSAGGSPSQTRNVAFGVSDRPAGYLQQLCLLAYLVEAKDLPVANRLVSVEKLDPGGFFFRGSHRLPVEKLASAFGTNPRLLHQAGQVLNAVPRAFGDASIELCVLPRIPITLVVWAADDEFPARASIFFDQSAAAQLPLDVLFAIATLTIEGILSTVSTIT